MANVVEIIQQMGCDLKVINKRRKTKTTTEQINKRKYIKINRLEKLKQLACNNL